MLQHILIYLPSLCSTTDTVTALQSSPCRKLMPPMARFSGNIEYVAVGKKTEVPLLIASLQVMKYIYIIEKHTTLNIQLNFSLNINKPVHYTSRLNISSWICNMYPNLNPAILQLCCTQSIIKLNIMDHQLRNL